MEPRKKILLVQLFSNGDCLYATAIARQIKYDFPGCHLTWAVAGFCKNVLDRNTYVDAIWEVNTVPKYDIVAYRKFKKESARKKRNGDFDEVFFTIATDNNQAYYDGCIRTNIFHAYPGKITQGIQPVLRFTEGERKKVESWVKEKKLSGYKHRILFEFAAQSGQMKITTADAIRIADQLSRLGNVAVILSSAHKINSANQAIIDGSELSYRESVLLSNYCSLMLGCSSGITWGTTSDGGQLLPMVQLLDPWTTWVNPISRDFKRQGLPVDQVIELIDFDEKKIVGCIQEILTNDFSSARSKYNQQVPLHFKTTRKIVYNLLCYLHFGAIAKHVKVNIKAFGWQRLFFKELLLAFFGFPFQLAFNIFRKKR